MSNDAQVFSDMQADKPYSAYRKTIVGKVSIQIINPFTGEPEVILLEGDAKTDPRAVIKCWSEKEDLFLKRRNNKAFELGTIIPVSLDNAPEEKPLVQYSDEELKEVLEKPYLSLRKLLMETESEPLLIRLLDMAKQVEKSDKVISNIENRLAEVQASKLPAFPSKRVVEV